MYELIAVAVLLAILGGCIALAVRYIKAATIAEDDLEEAEQELKHVADMIEGSRHAEKTRQKAIVDTMSGNIPDRLRKYYRD